MESVLKTMRCSLLQLTVNEGEEKSARRLSLLLYLSAFFGPWRRHSMPMVTSVVAVAAVAVVVLLEATKPMEIE